MTPEAVARVALGRARTRHAPDDRVASFEVVPDGDADDSDDTGRDDNDEVALRGVVGDHDLRRAAVRAVRQAFARQGLDAGVTWRGTVLAESASQTTVAEPVVPVHDAADPDAERVTGALYGADVTAFDAREGWRRVRVPDGYLGWVRRDALVAPGDATPDAVVVADAVDAAPGRIHGGVDCELLEKHGDAVEVRFRTGTTATLPADAVRRLPVEPGAEAVVAAAKRYLGTEYVWGGLTVEGIDCSGLVWQAYRAVGLALPRDTDQQQAVGRPVDRDDLAPGDLLFFPGHVGVSLGGDRFVHACGTAGETVVNSLDPADDDYAPDRAEGFETARRILD